LNLAAALWEARATRDNTAIAVIGGGAAGLTFSAAAALRGAHVTVFEQLEGLMELQRNNRQRWIHPHIYDWPDIDRSESADLPVLNWRAGYSENVAHQMEMRWRAIKDQTGRLTEISNARSVEPSFEGAKTRVTWNDTEQRERRFDIVVLAVGFGLEPDGEGRRSYWEEDGIDGSFRKPAQPQKWLVSGYGDGALTDLMRLCIHRFRHAEVRDLFSRSTYTNGIIEDLRRVHGDPKAADTAKAASYVHDQFQSLNLKDLPDILRPRIRKDKPEIYLTGKPPYYFYGPGSSVLNRLILRVLAKLDCFTHVDGPLKDQPRKFKQGWKVQLKQGERAFHAVLIRHGPDPRAIAYYDDVSKRCDPLREAWSRFDSGQDWTRDKLWNVGFFGPETEMEAPDRPQSAFAFERAVVELGIRTSNLAVFQELSSDGRSTVRFRIEGLSISAGQLSGLRFPFEASVGQILGPELDQSAKDLGISWLPDPPASLPSPAAGMKAYLEAAQQRGRAISGVFQFAAPLAPGSPPVSFGFSVVLLNGAATSAWEFEQMYSGEDLRHLDGAVLSNIEYLTRVIWFPTESLRIGVSLPSETPAPPDLTVFSNPENRSLRREDILSDNHLLMYPSADSQLNPRNSRWIRVTDPPAKAHTIVNTSAQTWEMSILRPAVGSCYSLDWPLPNPKPSPEGETIAARASEFRQRLLTYRKDRPKGALQTKFESLDRMLRRSYASGPESERFEVAMMTYDERQQRIVAVDSFVNGEPSGELWDFSLPFGLGLAGACFKQANSIYVYIRPPDGAASTSFYLPLEARRPHEILLCIPVDHRDFHQGVTLERSRQCIGVLSIGSDFAQTRLRKLVGVADAGPSARAEVRDRSAEAAQKRLLGLKEEIQAAFDELVE
jgi:hypothetical protein